MGFGSFNKWKKRFFAERQDFNFDMYPDEEVKVTEVLVDAADCTSSSGSMLLLLLLLLWPPPPLPLNIETPPFCYLWKIKTMNGKLNDQLFIIELIRILVQRHTYDTTAT
jgi:hypothetical protein